MSKATLDHFEQKNKQMPLVAVLRGITPDEAVAVSDVLVESGFTIMEVTLNSPDPYESIKRMYDRHGDTIALGAGTVLKPEQVAKVKDAGGRLIISPNLNLDVVAESVKCGLVSIPGCYTPSEAFTALDAGADVIKIFPADTLGVKFIKGIKAVLPTGTRICPTGGVSVNNVDAFLNAGVTSMGMGSALYKAGKSLDDIRTSAEQFVAAVHKAR